jgi:hypothetical protein
MAKVNDWRFFQQNVQSGLLEGRFMNAAFTMVAAGPPRLAATTQVSGDAELGDIAYPIGVLQSMSLGMNSQIMRLWEIGSERSYFIRGRTEGSLSLGRILYHGPSLLRVAYAYLNAGDAGGQLYQNSANAVLNTAGVAGSKQRFVLPPGYENMWVDLSSDVFSQPVGFLLYFRDSNEDTVGAFYLEYCMIANYGLSTDAGGTILSENCAVMFERIVPISVQAVALIANSDDVQDIVGSNVIGSAAGPGNL